MICLSVKPTSRQLAKVDLLNASRRCDLIELCLDHLVKEPNIPEMLEGIETPVLISCRRREEGGGWKGTEEQRISLLRQAIVAGPAYVELEHDIARSIPRFGKTKRVISHTSLHRPLANLEALIEDSAKANADVIKLTGPTPNLDAAWPLLAAVTRKRDIPVVGLGIGRGGTTLSLLGRKFGSPWLYAALEPGMETIEGQSTIFDLDEIYDWRRIDAKTSLIGVMGFEPAQILTVRVLNAGFRELDLPVRCLPFEPGRIENLPRQLETLRIQAVVVSPRFAGEIPGVAQQVEEAASKAEYADLLLKQSDGWHAINTIWRGALKALEDKLGRTSPAERPLDRRNVLVIGSNGVTQSLIQGVHRRKGVVSVAGTADGAAREIAQRFQIRHVNFAQLYDTLADVLVITDPQLVMGHRKSELNPSYLRPHMTVLDVSQLPGDSPFTTEARLRECRVVEPGAVFGEQLAVQFRALTGKDLPESARELIAAG